MSRGSVTSTISFDAGGVLLFPDWTRVSAALDTHGIHVSSSTLARADAQAKLAMDTPRDVQGTDNAGHSRVYFVELMRAAGVVDEALLAEGLAAVRAEHRRRSLWDAVGPDVVETLTRLRDAGRRLLVVSNSDGRLHELMRRTGLDGYFDLIVDSTEAGTEKPDPRIFHHALATLGASPDDTLHVGDFYEIDVIGARAAGVDAVLLDPFDLHTHRDCRRIRTLREL